MAEQDIHSPHLATSRPSYDAPNLAEEYPLRIVAFLDMLGFSNKVIGIKQDYDKFRVVHDIHVQIASQINKLNKMERDGLALFQTQSEGAKKVETAADLNEALHDPAFRQQFYTVSENISSSFGDLATEGWIANKDMGVEGIFLSDSILLHASNDEPNCYNLVSLVIGICRKLLLQGTMVRGAITCGPLFHTDSIVFGKALVEAAYLEKEVAKTSRVLIQPPIAANKLFYYDHTFEIGHTHDPLVKRDSDGLHFVDIFFADHQSRHVVGSRGKAPFFRDAREAILAFLAQSQTAKEWAKAAWLAQRFNDTIRRYAEWGISPIELQDPPAR